MNKNKGFTLIELLVVIAIIGILSSVVLASLNSARSKGNDAKVKAQLAGLRSAAEIVYDNSGNSYGISDPANVNCPATAGAFTADATIIANLNAMPSGTTNKCTVNAAHTAYAVASSITGTTTGQYWCVDSLGSSNVITITTIGNVVVTDSSCTAIDAR